MKKVSHWYDWGTVNPKNIVLHENHVIHYAGNSSQPKWRWWNQLWILSRWKNVLVLSTTTTVARDGYSVCFRLPDGQIKRCRRLCYRLRFAVSLGDGPCDFFILNRELKSENINQFDKCDRNDPPATYRNIPVF